MAAIRAICMVGESEMGTRLAIRVWGKGARRWKLGAFNTTELLESFACFTFDSVMSTTAACGFEQIEIRNNLIISIIILNVNLYSYVPRQMV